MTAWDKASIVACVRPCWVLKNNLRVSRDDKPWDEPCWRALVIESVTVHESARRQGVFKRFLASVVAESGYDLIVVEGVGNTVLADALSRWGWDFDPVVMDFYHFPGGASGHRHD